MREALAVIDRLSDTYQLMAKLLYGSGLRLMECVRLRVKDLDFAQRQIVVREGKGIKDHVTMLPEGVIPELQEHLRRVEQLHKADVDKGLGFVYLPSALERKYPNAFQYWLHTTDDCTGCDPVVWDVQANGWACRDGGSGGNWSELIFACGSKNMGKGGAVITDARKSAVTDGLTKAASMIGVGHEVFKGLVGVGGNRGTGGNGRKQQADSTTFWTLYRTESAAADIPIETPQGPGRQGGLGCRLRWAPGLGAQAKAVLL